MASGTPTPIDAASERASERASEHQWYRSPESLRLSAYAAGIPKTGISTHGPRADVEPWLLRCYRSTE